MVDCYVWKKCMLYCSGLRNLRLVVLTPAWDSWIRSSILGFSFFSIVPTTLLYLELSFSKLLFQNGPLSWGENFICCTQSMFSVPLNGPTSLTTVSLMVVVALPNDEFIFETNNLSSLCFIRPDDWLNKCIKSNLGKTTAKTSWTSSNWILVWLEFQYQSLFIPHLK